MIKKKNLKLIMENWSTRPKGKTIGIYTFCILKIKRTLLICLFQSFVFPQFSSSLDLTFPHVIAAGGHGMRKRPQDSRQLKVALGNCGNISTKKGKWCWKKDKEYVRLSLSWSCFTNALWNFQSHMMNKCSTRGYWRLDGSGMWISFTWYP